MDMTIMKKYILSLALFGALAGMTTSCEDMLDKGNDYVIYADDHVLCNPADTVTSLLGILNKLQGIAVRTNLLGELRADLVTVNDNATTDLKDLAALEISDSNAYNAPRDYYAVINNCNYYLAFADSTAGNTNRNEKYFRTEIAQVHSIRAWTYLQLVLNYGKVPMVTEPVLTNLQSDAEYPMAEIVDICDYFINDLKPYYGREYPDPQTVGGTVDPQMCFFPTQVVMGDLYLWKAAINHDASAAKEAAKCYYDYIVWDLSGKENLYLPFNNRVYWNANAITNDKYSWPSGGISYGQTGTWGSRNQECVTVIPMDSASAEGYYNELRNLYNTTNDVDLREASISPSSLLRELSQAQEYVAYDNYNNVKYVTADKFTEEEINDGFLGDLRYQDSYSQTTTKWNSQEVDYQSIGKQSYQHVGIYRAAQIYLRMAEALNYAGYPRFARQILTMGLNNTVIQNEVQRYYTSASDSAFISYFDFNTTDFLPYAESYSQTKDSLGVVSKVTPVLRASTNNCNMLGIHSRGSGWAFLNENYAVLATPDSTAFPRTEAEAVGHKPASTDSVYVYPEEPTAPRVVRKPSTWDAYPNVTVDEDTYKELNSWYTKSRYTNYVNKDSVGNYNTYLTVTYPAYEAEMAVYQAKVDSVNAILAADLAAYEARLQTFTDAYNVWYEAAYSNSSLISQEQESVDQAILDEQALEMVYEGNRFYDLMRRAYWYNDNTILSNAVSRRDATAGSRLTSRTNWFLNWKGKIGY